MKARHRTTFKEYTGNSVTLPIETYLPTEWKENGVIKTRSVPDCDEKYWKIVSEQFKEMTANQKAAVDQAEADAIAQVEADAKDVTKFPIQLKAVALALGKAQGLTPAEIKSLVETELA